MKDLMIITGGSHGLGAALLARSLEQGHEVVTLSRSRPSAGRYIACDFSQPDTIKEAFLNGMKDYAGVEFGRLILVNNAAILGPVGSAYDAVEVSNLLNINLSECHRS